MLETPVLLCIFNRPRLTEQVFAAIAKQKPKQLLIVGDGPRDSYAEDSALVEETRRIVKQINWDCEVLTNFSRENLGCRQRMATGLDWAFEQAERLIVLEDDCLPSDAFFEYSEAMLDKFADDPSVGMICGDQFLPDLLCATDAYYSKFPYVWGWASWRRAWKYYDLEMNNWPQRNNDAWLRHNSCSQREAEYWQDIFARQHAGEIDTWDYSWIFNCWDQQLLSIHPRENLVSNIGFGSDATHTTDPNCKLANLPTQHRSSGDQWLLPVQQQADSAIDARIFNEVYCPVPEEVEAASKNSAWQKIKRWFAA